MSFFLSKVKSGAKGLVGGGAKKRCKLQFGMEVSLVEMPSSLSGGALVDAMLAISLSRGAKVATTELMPNSPALSRLNSSNGRGNSGTDFPVMESAASTAGSSSREAAGKAMAAGRLEFISTLTLLESGFFEPKPFKLRICQMCPDHSTLVIGSTDLDIATLAKAAGGRPVEHALATHTVSVPLRTSHGVAASAVLSLVVSTRWIITSGGSGGGHSLQGTGSADDSDAGLSDMDQLDGDFPDNLIFSEAQHRIQTRSGNLNSSIVVLGEECLSPTSPPTPANYATYNFLGPPQMTTRHIEDLRVMQQALEASEERYNELATRSAEASTSKPRPSQPLRTMMQPSLQPVLPPPASDRPLRWGQEEPKEAKKKEEDEGESEVVRLRREVARLNEEVARLTDALEASGSAELAR